MRTESANSAPTEAVRNRLHRRISLLDVCVVAPLVLFVLAAGPQCVVNIPRMRWAQWLGLPLQLKTTLILLWLVTIAILLFGKFSIGTSSIVIERQRKPVVFWLFFSFWTISMAFATQVVLMFWN